MPKITKAEQRRLLREMKKRIKENEDKQVDNSSLRAGACMQYYCRMCGVLTTVLAESDFFSQIETHCGPCKQMIDCGYSVTSERFLELADQKSS